MGHGSVGTVILPVRVRQAARHRSQFSGDWRDSDYSVAVGPGEGHQAVCGGRWLESDPEFAGKNSRTKRGTRSHEKINRRFAGVKVVVGGKCGQFFTHWQLVRETQRMAYCTLSKSDVIASIGNVHPIVENESGTIALPWHQRSAIGQFDSISSSVSVARSTISALSDNAFWPYSSTTRRSMSDSRSSVAL